MQLPQTISPILISLLLHRFASADVYSCPGVFHVESGDVSACCVGGTIPPVVLSTCPGWPLCTGPATTTTTSEPLSCATDIPFTADNYYQLVASASSSLKASGTHIQTTVGNGAVIASVAGITAAPTNSAGSGGSSTPSSVSSQGTASTNGGAMFKGSITLAGAYVFLMAML